MLVDSFDRTIRNLRISITDRCNLRCLYCMPAHPHWMERKEILTFEELTRLARVAVSLGVEKIRLTGGEPTVRRDFPDFVRQLSHLEGLKDLSVTTNGILLDTLAQPLWDSGLRRINISLDTLKEDRFKEMTRREAFRRTWKGLEAADRVGFSPLKVNVVVIKGHNEDEVVDFARLAREKLWQVRFIEFMPLDAEGQWNREKVVPAQEIIDRISAVFPVEEVPDVPASDPARRYRFLDGSGEFGVIASVTEPFCGSCDRIRITADGKLRTCLFSHRETDLKTPMREGVEDAHLAEIIKAAVWKKEAGHGMDDPGFLKPDRAMYQIGG
jgi:cyclic pyranopterin phosphate synthase